MSPDTAIELALFGAILISGGVIGFVLGHTAGRTSVWREITRGVRHRRGSR